MGKPCIKKSCRGTETNGRRKCFKKTGERDKQIDGRWSCKGRDDCGRKKRNSNSRENIPGRVDFHQGFYRAFVNGRKLQFNTHERNVCEEFFRLHISSLHRRELAFS